MRFGFERTLERQEVEIIERAEDFQLLRRFVEDNSQEAFGQLVERHLCLVYSICRRETGDAVLAEDVTQAVFLILAQKAPSIREGTLMVGWFFKTSRFASRNALRQEARRQHHEQAAIAEMMHGTGQADSSEDTWQAIEPLLHDGIATLGNQDREAVLLHYFENKSFKEVGGLLGTSENTARMRVARAIEKLKRHLKKRGVAVPSALLAVLLSEHAVQAVPLTCSAAVAGLLTNGVTAGVGAVGAGVMAGKAASISKGVLKSMFVNKVKATLIATGLSLSVAGGGVWAERRSSAANSANIVHLSADTNVADKATKPQDMLKAVLDRYEKPSSFSMRIQHQDSSGLFPGKYTQTLQWRKGGHFELLVTANNEQNTVPNYYANGKQVISVQTDGTTYTEDIEPRPNSMPGWEVSGGMILGTLQDTDNSRVFFNPLPQGIEATYKIGPRTQWHDQAVHELIVGWDRGGRSRSISYFISEDEQSLIGCENQINGKVGWELYSEQKIDPDLPATLGDRTQ